MVNQIAGRRGAILIAAVLIAGTSLGAGFLQAFDEDGTGESNAWRYLVALRLFNGIGMGIKAVSTPILASETAIGYWRGLSPSTFIRHLVVEGRVDGGATNSRRPEPYFVTRKARPLETLS